MCCTCGGGIRYETPTGKNFNIQEEYILFFYFYLYQGFFFAPFPDIANVLVPCAAAALVPAQGLALVPSNLRSVQIKCCDLCGCAATNYLYRV